MLNCWSEKCKLYKAEKKGARNNMHVFVDIGYTCEICKADICACQTISAEPKSEAVNDKDNRIENAITNGYLYD